MELPLDYVAITGYSLLFIFGLLQFPWTSKNKFDLVANVLLLSGLGALITYHIYKIKEGKDETRSKFQKSVRVVAHSCLVAFLVLTLIPQSGSIFRFYDGFALAAHIILLIAVLTEMNQLAGVGLLAVYFLFASFQTAYINKSNEDFLLLFGRVLMLMFFSAAFVEGVASSKKTENKSA